MLPAHRLLAPGTHGVALWRAVIPELDYPDVSAEMLGMTNSHASAIVILLALILAVLLFGSGAILSGIGWLLAAVVAIGIVWLVAVLVVRATRGVGDALKADREAGNYYSSLIGYIGMFGNFAVCGVAFLTKGEHEPFKHALGDIPLFWLPVALLLSSIPLSWIEKTFAARHRKSTPPNPPTTA